MAVDVCSGCGSSGPFARGGGPHNALCDDCAADEVQGRETVRHPHGTQHPRHE